jgi:hypothetical protein
MLMYVHNRFSPFELVVVVVFIIVGAVAAVRQRDAARKRSLDLQVLSTKLGFADFNPGPDPGFIEGWCFLNRFSQGENRYAFNVLQGVYQEQKLFIFDYHYRTGSGKDAHDHYYTIFMLIVKEVFPGITVGPENLVMKIDGMFDSENIKFESAEFSKTFRVRSPDKKFAYDVCNPQMIEFLLANRGLEFEINGPAILLAFNPQLPVDQIEPNLQRLAQIRALLPQYLFEQTSQ